MGGSDSNSMDRKEKGSHRSPNRLSGVQSERPNLKGLAAPEGPHKAGVTAPEGPHKAGVAAPEGPQRASNRPRYGERASPGGGDARQAASKNNETGESRNVGRFLPCVETLTTELVEVSRRGYGFVVAPLIHPHPPKSDHLDADDDFFTHRGAFTNCFRDFTSNDWESLVVGCVPSWINVDASCSSLREKSFIALKQQFALASHLSLPALMIPLRQSSSANLAMLLTSYIHNGPNQQLWLRVPMMSGQPEFEELFLCENERWTLDEKDEDGDDDDAVGNLTKLCAACEAAVAVPAGREKRREVKAPPSHSSSPLPDTRSPKTESLDDWSVTVAPSSPLTDRPTPPSTDESAWFVAESLRAVADDRVVQRPESRDEDPWEWFNCVRVLSDSALLINVALVIPRHLPSIGVVRRWLGEKIRCAILPTSVFRINERGYPVLPMSHQVFLHKLMKMKTQFVIAGPVRSAAEDTLYRVYVEYLYRSQPPPFNPDMERFALSYRDFLSVPSQPLVDEIDSFVFEGYESDRSKNILYFEAMKAALTDKLSEDADREFIVMVLLAARGNLVKLSLKAAKSCGARIKVLAVEPNSNAVSSLNLFYGDKPEVKIVSGVDSIQGRKVDIMVSDLLGSFACDSLNPEVVDFAMRNFLRDDGIVIPSEYTSFAAPIQSPTLLNRVRVVKEPNHLFHDDFPYETMYVTLLNNCCVIAEPKPVFEFRHFSPGYPGRGVKSHIHLLSADLHLCQFRSLEWLVDRDSLCHGFAGYFRATLYKSTRVSTLPESHTVGLISWFPAFFPLRNPQHLRRGELLAASFWRRSRPQRAWYEWTLLSPRPMPVHNLKGRAHYFVLKFPFPIEDSNDDNKNDVFTTATPHKAKASATASAVATIVVDATLRQA